MPSILRVLPRTKKPLTKDATPAGRNDNLALLSSLVISLDQLQSLDDYCLLQFQLPTPTKVEQDPTAHIDNQAAYKAMTTGLSDTDACSGGHKGTVLGDDDKTPALERWYEEDRKDEPWTHLMRGLGSQI